MLTKSSYTTNLEHLQVANLQIGETQTALRGLIKIATALQQRKETDAANYLRQKAVGAAKKANDRCLGGSDSCIGRDRPSSLYQCSRCHLPTYRGDRLSAYEALVVGWVTISDLMGREVARSMFEPKLLELRDRWGIEIFKDIKSSYEAKRREKCR
jgi:hypothetical protein